MGRRLQHVTDTTLQRNVHRAPRHTALASPRSAAGLHGADLAIFKLCFVNIRAELCLPTKESEIITGTIADSSNGNIEFYTPAADTSKAA